MRTRSAVACALGLAATLGGCAVHAQTITRQTAALPGKLVIASDQGTMFRVSAGGPARYRASLATASRLLDVLERDSGIVAPIGYEMRLWRIAGPNDPPVAPYFPSSSGIFGVLLYYYHDDRAVATHGVAVSDEGPPFTVGINDPHCVLGNAVASDTAGDMLQAAPRREDYHGYPTYGADGGCIVVTASSRPLTAPVSRERLLRALIRTARANHDAGTAGLSHLRAEHSDSAATSQYHAWLAQRPARDSQQNAIYAEVKKQNPAQAAAYLRNMRATDSAIDASFHQRMTAKTNPVDAEMAAEGNRLDSAATKRIHDMEAELAAMSPAERQSPAYYEAVQGASGSGLVAPDAPGAVAIVTLNPAFRDRSRAESAPQVITVMLPCRTLHGTDASRSCPSEQRRADYERILSHLDWDALRALTAAAP